MTEAPPNTAGNSPGWEQRTITLSLAAISLLLAIAFTLGVLLADSEDLGGASGRSLMALLGLFCWCLGASFLLGGITPGRHERLAAWLTGIGLTCFALFFVGMLLRGDPPPSAQDASVTRRAFHIGPTVQVLLGAYLLVTIIAMAVERRPRKKPAPESDIAPHEPLGSLVLLWPVLLVGVMRPWQSLSLFGLAFGFTYGGQRWGAAWGHPTWGASLGLVFFLTAGFGLLAWAGTRKNS